MFLSVPFSLEKGTFLSSISREPFSLRAAQLDLQRSLGRRKKVRSAAFLLLVLSGTEVLRWPVLNRLWQEGPAVGLLLALVTTHKNKSSEHDNDAGVY